MLPTWLSDLLPDWLEEILPILILLVVVAIVIARLPRIELDHHTTAFRGRRLLNWLPLGLTYACLLYTSPSPRDS